MLVLALVLGPGEFDGRVGHVVPRVVDADEQEQHRSLGDDEQYRHRIAREQNRRDDEGGVGDERKDRMPQPVFQHRLIVRLGDVLADLLSLCCADLPGLCDVAVHDARAGTGSQLGAAVSEGNMAGSRKI